MSTGHILSTLLPLRSIQLGCLVISSANPHREFLNPLAGQRTEEEATKNTQTDFKETMKFSRCSNIPTDLSDAFSISYERQDNNIATLAAPLLTCYDLKNPGGWFNKACAQPETQRFLESAIDDGRSVYLVVGLRTVQDAVLVKRFTPGKTEYEPLLQTISSAMVNTDMVLGLGDVGASAIQDTSSRQRLFPDETDEHILAVIYRKVKFKLLSSSASLEQGNRWKSFWDWRGEEGGEDDVIEADFTDSEMSGGEYGDDETEYTSPPNLIYNPERSEKSKNLAKANRKRKRDENTTEDAVTIASDQTPVDLYSTIVPILLVERIPSEDGSEGRLEVKLGTKVRTNISGRIEEKIHGPESFGGLEGAWAEQQYSSQTLDYAMEAGNRGMRE